MKLDLGCGANKKPGFIGLDYLPAPGVDHVLDLTKDRFPLGDATVDHVYSSHFFEHITEINHLFQEIARVCRDGAKIEFWTPYAFTNEAFLAGHVAILSEEPWLHFCVYHRDTHMGLLCGRWLLRNINYVVRPEVEKELLDHGFSIDFAIRYLKSVVLEFGVDIEFRRDLSIPAVTPVRTYSYSREGPRYSLQEPAGGRMRKAAGRVRAAFKRLFRR
jgi:SAM-dependent methyltransferase